MATEKVFNTRILNKIDTLEQWNKSTLPLKKGEIALATIAASAGTGLTEPVIMIKIGEDGIKTFKELPWNFYAKASDVIAAAKSESALTEFVNNIIANAGIATDEAITALSGRVSAVESGVSNLNALVGDAAVATQIQNAIAELRLDETYDSKGSASAVQSDLNSYKSSNDTAVAAAKKAGDDAQSDVNTLKEKVGTVPDDKTVTQMISEATYDDTALKGRVSTVEGKVTTLVGSDADKSARSIAAEEVAKIIAGADTAYDTLKEISDWISSHKTDAAAMNSAITKLEGLVGETSVDSQIKAAIEALKIGDYAKAADLTAAIARIATLEGKAHTHSNKTLLDTYTQTEANLADAVSKKHNHSNKDVLDGITSTKVSAWDKVSEKVNDSDLAAIAKTGNINDLIQTSGDVIIFDCGTSSTVI